MLGQRGPGLSLLNLIRLIVRIKSSTSANIKQQNKILILYICSGGYIFSIYYRSMYSLEIQITID